jgi:uncharacterized glyoxalase superfamily protein PhnB
MHVTKLIPVLVYSDIQRAHDFLVEVFGFGAGGVERDGAGRPVHGEVTAGETTIWLHAVSADHRMDTPNGKPANHGGFVVQVADVDEHFERVRAAGARIESAPADREYGLREYGVSDPEGHRWWFAGPISAR